MVQFKANSVSEHSPSAGAPARRMVKRVLVEYESSTHGRAALLHALSIVRHAEAALTVVAVATPERVGVGCMRCRSNAAMWNREMRSLAEDALAEAAELVGRSRAIEFAVAYGDGCKSALASAALRSEAELIVVPWRPNGRLRRLASTSVAEHLRRDGAGRSWSRRRQPIGAQARTSRGTPPLRIRSRRRTGRRKHGSNRA